MRIPFLIFRSESFVFFFFEKKVELMKSFSLLFETPAVSKMDFSQHLNLFSVQLQKPLSHKPMIRFGSVPFTHTDSTIKRHFKGMHAYMSQFNKSKVKDGVDAVINR